jgi:glycerol-3-phosphate acyltransferase PlsX
VGLLNNGTEDTKGTPVHQEAYKLWRKTSQSTLSAMWKRELLNSVADVVVTDGSQETLC